MIKSGYIDRQIFIIVIELGIDSEPQSVKEQLRQEEIKTHKKHLELPKQEYAELCSAIKTKYGNKIPKGGGILYKNNYYEYTYNKRTEQILFTKKLDIDRDHLEINRLEELWKKKSQTKWKKN